MAGRPVSRRKTVSGSGSVNRRGSGLGSGPVGGHSGGHFGGRRSSGDGSGGGGGIGGILGVIIALVIFFIGGFNGLSGSNSGNNSGYDSSSGSSDIMSAFLNNHGTSSQGNFQWSSDNNTGVLNENVALEARKKYTVLKGNGDDVVTIMVYMCGTDLESRGAMASKDIQEMLNADISDKINLLIYTGGCANWRNSTISSKTNQIYQVKGGKLQLLKDNIGDLPMTDPSTLSSYIKWAGSNYPADRYALIFWDHGGGSVSGYGYDEKHKSAGSMNLAGINKALTAGGLKYDFVGFDACLMATVETGLMLDAHSDYMIGSEETEPGIGWYYTRWLNELSADTSMSTLKIGKNIADDFVSECASNCPGQKTTLSVVDVAELSATVPEDLKNFASSTTQLIDTKQYQTVSTARSSSREFATSSKIDQIDLIDFALKLGNNEGTELANSLKSAVKYNKTSNNMTNAYGLSIYFPYRTTSKVDNMVSTYDEIGMDDSYSQCIQKFASMAYYGQAASSGSSTTNPASMLFGTGESSGSMDSAQAVMQLLNAFMQVSGDRNTAFLNNGVDMETAAEYIAKNNISSEDLTWKFNDHGDKIVELTEEQWDEVDKVDLSLFVDDGTGYIDLGLDNVLEWDDDDNLKAPTDRSWIAIDNQIVAYYHIDTIGDQDDYVITGRVPVMLNGVRADLILVFTSDNESGYVAGATYDYHDGETEVIAKNLTTLEAGDKIDFLCDYYSYDGTYNDSYYLGQQMTVPGKMSDMKITNLVIEDKDILLSYVVTDMYGNTLYTEGLEQ